MKFSERYKQIKESSAWDAATMKSSDLMKALKTYKVDMLVQRKMNVNGHEVNAALTTATVGKGFVDFKSEGMKKPLTVKDIIAALNEGEPDDVVNIESDFRGMKVLKKVHGIEVTEGLGGKIIILET